MYATPPGSVYPDIVRLAGGPDSLLKITEGYFENEEYVKILHLTDMILEGNPHHRETHEVRLKALKALKARTRNYIELIWLDYGIRLSEEQIKAADIGERSLITPACRIFYRD
jgi:hypothetical protein